MKANYDYSMLTGKIIEKYGTRDRFAQELGITKESMSLKLKGKTPWKQVEIDNACRLLGLKKIEIGTYFFTVEVRKNRTKTLEQS